MRFAAALCVLTLAACAAEDPQVRAERNWRVCNGDGATSERLKACGVVAGADVTAERRAAALLARGVMRLQEAQYVRAIADFGRTLRISPNNTEALFRRGVAHYDRGAFDAAERDFAAVVAINPSHEAAGWIPLLGEARAEGFNAQLTHLNSLIDLRPEDWNTLNTRCWLRAVRGVELEQALQDCNEALRLNAAFEHAFDSRGLVHYKLGQFEAALADYDAALKIDETRGHFMFGRGLSLKALGRVEEAEAAFAAAEAAEPGIAALYLTYGAAPV